MPAPLTLYVVRHGEVYNPEKVFYGRRPNFRLSDEGNRQAQEAGRVLSQYPLDAIYASPQLRAQETAQHILVHHPLLPLTTDERVAEVYTPHDGRELAILEANGFDIYTGNTPPYEVLSNIRARVVSFLMFVRQQHPNGKVAVTTHGDIVLNFLAIAFGLPHDYIAKERLLELGFSVHYPATASITALTFNASDEQEKPAWSYLQPY